MSDLAALTHGVLLRVADFLRTVPADQLAALAAGTATLQLVPAGADGAGAGPKPTAKPPARRTTKAAAKPLPVPAAEVRGELVRLADRAAARRHLEELKLTAAQLRVLAAELNIAVPAKATRPVIMDQVVQWTIGRRLDSEAISRPGPVRYA